MDHDHRHVPSMQPPRPMHPETSDDSTSSCSTYKTCSNPRAAKRHGDFHPSCETHHVSANNTGQQTHVSANNAGQQTHVPTKVRPLDGGAPSSSSDAVMLCKYVYKPCSNPRTLKRNGELHSLCAEHQAKANSCQKQYAKKKRKLSKTIKAQAKNETDVPTPPTSIPTDSNPSSMPTHPTSHSYPRSTTHPSTDPLPRFPPLPPPPLSHAQSYQSAISHGHHEARSASAGRVEGSYAYPRLPPVPSLHSLFPPTASRAPPLPPPIWRESIAPKRFE